VAANRRLVVFGAALAVALAAVSVSRCGGASPSSPSSTPIPAGPGTGAPGPPVTLVGAGDIGNCKSQAVAQTADLVEQIPGIVFTTGDNAYPHGSAADFRDCYTPFWGRFRSRTRPSPGNHEYMTAGAAPYYEYFGANAGPSGLGYYAFSAGSWRVIALNSEVMVGPGSAQLEWLRDELNENRSRCTMAYWHKPLFTSGPNGPNRDMREIWRVLYEFDADLVINGHDHLYERFAPQDPDGRGDSARGIRQITVGTGGGDLYSPVMSAANTEANGHSFGVLKLTLADTGYQWEFVPVPGSAFTDRGLGQCH
jgi:alkaline phosphatase